MRVFLLILVLLLMSACTADVSPEAILQIPMATDNNTELATLPVIGIIIEGDIRYEILVHSDPERTIPIASINMGEMRQAESYQYHFQVTNSGTRDLWLSYEASPVSWATVTTFPQELAVTQPLNHSTATIQVDVNYDAPIGAVSDLVVTIKNMEP